MNIRDFPYILYRFDKAKSDDFFEIKSSGKRIISNKEYLSTSKGAEGQIVGFLEYDPEREIDDERALHFTTITGGITAFQDKNHPDLIILNPWSLFELAWESKLVESTNGYTINDTIQPTPGVIKFARLGSLMPVPNDAEINFIGDAKITTAQVIRNISRYSYPKIRDILDKVYTKFYNEFRTLPQPGLNQEFPKDTAENTRVGGKKTRKNRSKKRKTRKH